MKGFISILLTLLLLLNALGYYGIFFGLQYQNGAEMMQAFDKGTYNEEKEIIFETPISIPYNGDTPFQRVDGTFEYKGEFYRLVKQRFHNDTLQVVFIRDDRHKEIHEKIVSHTRQHDSSKSTIDFIKEYLSQKTDVVPLTEGWQRTTVHFPIPDFLFNVSRQLESPPPKEV